MKNRYIFITLALVVACCAIVVFMQNSTPELKTEKSHFKVAILSPAVHPSLEKIAKAYSRTLNDSPNASYSVTIFNGAGDGQRMALFANKCVNDDFDAIFTIGTGATLLIKNLLFKHASTTPQIFTAVSHPETMGITQAAAHVTGILEENDFDLHIDLVCKMLPALKRFLLIYCPTGGSNLEQDKELVERKVSSMGHLFKAVAIFSPAEIPTKTTEAIKQSDIVMILKDNVAVSGLDGLLKLCNRFEKPLI